MNYYYTEDGSTIIGPLTLSELRGERDRGSLTYQAQVCTEGTEIWYPLSDILPSAAHGRHREHLAKIDAAASLNHSKVEQAQKAGVIGALILAVGVFCPLVSIPIVGSINYFHNGSGDGIFALGLAAFSVFFAIAKRFKLMNLSGILAIILLSYTFVRFQTHMGEARHKMEADLRDNPFSGLAEVAMNSVQIQWGLPVMAIGAILIVVAGTMIAPSKNKSK